MKPRTIICVCTLVLAATACAWVKPTSGGAQVREATAADVVGCEMIGTASGTTQATAAGLPRNKEVMRDEQVTLARNQAAVIGGDTIVANGPPQGGMQAFIVYRCR